MSMDNSLKVKAGMAGVRSVLTRAERISKMQVEKRFDGDKSNPLGIPKTRLIKK
jgi:small basic protein (TIGR04137 family)